MVPSAGYLITVHRGRVAGFFTFPHRLIELPDADLDGPEIAASAGYSF